MRFRQITFPSHPMRKCVGCAAGLILAVTLLAGCGGGEKAAAQVKKGGATALVRVAQLQQKRISRKIIVVGNVTPVRTSVVASGANGVVKYLCADPDGDKGENAAPASPVDSLALPEIEQGQYVTTGTVLSVLRMETADSEVDQAVALLEEREEKLQAAIVTHPEEVAHAEAMVGAATAVKNNATQKWERTRTLYNRGAATDAELEDAQEKWKGASESLIAAQRTLERIKGGREIEQAKASRDAQAAQVRYLKTERDKRTTKAPFDGFIVKMHTYKGQWLSKGDPVATLAKLESVDVIVNIDQADLPYVRVGQTAQVTVEGADKTEWTGDIVHIVPQSDWEHGSRGFPVVVRIKNEFHTVDLAGDGGTTLQKVPVLKAGMIARVTILGPEVDTLLAPKDALVRATRGTFLFTFDPLDKNAPLDPKKPAMGAVRQIPVEGNLNMSDGESIEVRVAANDPSIQGNPLKPGLWVVTEGGERLRPAQDNVNALSRLEDKDKNKPAAEAE